MNQEAHSEAKDDDQAATRIPSLDPSSRYSWEKAKEGRSESGAEFLDSPSTPAAGSASGRMGNGDGGVRCTYPFLV